MSTLDRRVNRMFEFLSLRTVTAPTTITAFASEVHAGTTFVLIAALHVDLAEESTDSELTSILTGLVSSVRLAAQPQAPPSAILQQFDARARSSGRYYSAASVITDGSRMSASSAGLACLMFGGPGGIRTAIPPQTIDIGPFQHILTNAVGSPHFVRPTDSEWQLLQGETLLSVGGLLQDDPQLYTVRNPRPVLPVPTARGGIVMRIRPSEQNFQTT
jgi:hypothetical protein